MYAKIFSSIYDGTLGTRGPWEALVTFQQLIILADRFGVVDKTPEKISTITLIPLEIIQKGIEHLLKPDPLSRRGDEDGRRIIPIDPSRNWGWQITNYAHYRAIRNAEERREYQRNYMREKREAEKKRVEQENTFQIFWDAYPRKVAKMQAARAWLKLAPDDELLSKIMTALKQHKDSLQWRKDNGAFIPHPASWLNGRRWEDVLTAPITERKVAI